MASIKLTGDTSGEITISAPAVAGTNTLTLPAATGNIITTGDSGTVTQDMIGSGVATTGPAFSAYMSVSQSVTGAVSTKVAFNAEQFDTNSNYDNTTNYRFTPSVEGYYQVNVSVYVDVAGRAFVRLYKNGSEEFRMGDIDSTDTRILNGSGLIYMNGTTDYLEVYAYRQTTGNINGGDSVENQFSAFLARAV
jgi:hypothetical protein